MQTELTNLHHLFNNIFGFLSNIPFDYLNNIIPSYCVIFIIVSITLLGFVLFAQQSQTTIPVDSLLDTQADLERRKNDNRIPLDLVYQRHHVGARVHSFLVDRNDSTGIRMAALFPNRPGSFRVINGVVGLLYTRDNVPGSRVGLNNQNELLINVNNYSLFAVDVARGVQSRGLPIQRTPHARSPNDITVLTVLSDFNINTNTNNNNN
jgi:hypothetical protein